MSKRKGRKELLWSCRCNDRKNRRKDLERFLFTEEDKERCFVNGKLVSDCQIDMVDTMIEKYNLMIEEMSKQ